MNLSQVRLTIGGVAYLAWRAVALPTFTPDNRPLRKLQFSSTFVGLVDSDLFQTP